MKVYILTMTLWNGTVPMKRISSVFSTKELAELACSKMKKKNINNQFSLGYNIEETDFYQNINEVPILND